MLSIICGRDRGPEAGLKYGKVSRFHGMGAGDRRRCADRIADAGCPMMHSSNCDAAAGSLCAVDRLTRMLPQCRCGLEEPIIDSGIQQG